MGNLEAGLGVGYGEGLAAQGYLQIGNVVGPIGLRASAGYILPSDPIKDNIKISAGTDSTGTATFGAKKEAGQASESGHFWTFGLDASYKLGDVLADTTLTSYAGLRYGIFTVSEQYSSATVGTGGSTSSGALGLGAGLLFNYSGLENLNLFADFGIDHYLSSPFADGPLQKTFSTADPNYSERRSRYGIPSNLFKMQLGLQFSFY